MNQNIDEQEKIYMEKVNPEIKENIKYIENKNETNSKNESEEKRKRRTKNDNIGRTFNLAIIYINNSTNTINTNDTILPIFFNFNFFFLVNYFFIDFIFFKFSLRPG